VQQIGEGTINFVLVANGQFPIDGLGLIQPGTEAPPCAAFVFAFNWQITDPYPPGDSQVTWEIIAQDNRNEVASGAAGTASVGCGQLIALNNGPDQIGVSVHYIPVYWHPYYQRLGYQKGLCPVAEGVYERLLTLPLFPAMEDRDVEDVIAAVTKVLENFSR